MKKRVLIVDDEILIRIGIRHSVDWEEFGMEVAAEAADGEACLKFVAQSAPDLIILDINMPQLDGIQVLRRLKQQGFTGKVIVLTCYEELQYVREAMKNGACDYVLKTSIEEDGLGKAIRELTFEDAGLAEGNPKDEGMRKVLEERELIRILDGYGAYGQFESIRPEHLFCVGIRIMDWDEVRRRYQNRDMTLFYQSVDSILRQALAGQREYLHVQYKADRLVLFLSMSGTKSMQEGFLMLRQTVQLLYTALKGYLDVEVCIGVSGEQSSFGRMRKAYEEAEAAAEQRFLYPQRTIFYYQGEPAGNKEAEAAFREKEGRVWAAAQEKNYPAVQEELADYFELLRASVQARPERVKRFITELFPLIIKAGQEQYRRTEERILGAASLEDLESVLYGLLDGYSGQEEAEQTNYLIRRAEAYIRDNYRQNITLGSVAAFLNLSESYASRLFNKHKGMNLPMYVNGVRIERAKELLLHTDLKIYEVAEQTGYASTTAFHIAFKKAESMTPVEYKNKYR